MKRVQSSIQSELVQNVGVHAEVDCAGPRYRVLKGGAHFSCLIAGIPHLTTIATKVGSNGEISASIPRGFPSREAALSGPLIAEHKAGRRVFASGELLEEIIETQLPLFKAFAAKQNLKLGVLSCPASSDLSGRKRATCHLSVSGKEIRLAFWIEGTGWRMEPVDLPYSRTAIEAAATRYYRELVRNNGFKAQVVVHCPWPDVLVVTPPESRDCVLTTNRHKRRLTVQVPSRNGAFNYYVW